MDVDQLKNRFYLQPTINPVTGKKLIYGKGPYNSFVQQFGDPYQTPIITSEEFNVDLFNLPDDMLKTIFYNIKPNKIGNICSLNNRSLKLCDSNFWNEKFKQDFPILYDSGFRSKNYNEYINIIHAHKNARKQARRIKNSYGFFFKISQDITWLPESLLIIALSKRQQKQAYQLVIYGKGENKSKNEYFITPAFMTWPYNKDSIDINKQETIMYITKLFYYNPEIKWELIQGG